MDTPEEKYTRKVVTAPSFDDMDELARLLVKAQTIADRIDTGLSIKLIQLQAEVKTLIQTRADLRR